MATEKRLIDVTEPLKLFHGWLKQLELTEYAGDKRGVESCIAALEDEPTVDAVPVDEIRVDILKISLENQEAVLNISICGKPYEVKAPFSKEVVEVVRCKDCFANGCCSVQIDLDMGDEGYCPKGRKESR